MQTVTDLVDNAEKAEKAIEEGTHPGRSPSAFPFGVVVGVAKCLKTTPYSFARRDFPGDH